MADKAIVTIITNALDRAALLARLDREDIEDFTTSLWASALLPANVVPIGIRD